MAAVALCGLSFAALPTPYGIGLPAVGGGLVGLVGAVAAAGGMGRARAAMWVAVGYPWLPAAAGLASRFLAAASRDRMPGGDPGPLAAAAWVAGTAAWLLAAGALPVAGGGGGLLALELARAIDSADRARVRARCRLALVAAGSWLGCGALVARDLAATFR